MTKPFRFRYVNELVGGFVLLVLAALVATVFIAGHAQHWFEPKYSLRTTFSAEGTFGLQKGAPVDCLGTRVGTVRDIFVEESGQIGAVFEIRGDFIRFIRQDSVAVIKKQFGVAGDSYVDITPGKGDSIAWGESPAIPCRKDTEVTELLESLLEQVREAVLPAIDEVTKTLAEYRRLAEDFRDPQSQLQQTIAHLNAIAGGLEAGEGTAGKLLRDPSLADQAGETVKQVNAILAQIRDAVKQAEAVIGDVKGVTTHLPEVSDTVRGEVKDLPGMVLQAQVTLREAERTLEALQRNWLLRRYLTTEGGVEPISPDVLPGAAEGTP